jgi:hypothetical protein
MLSGPNQQFNILLENASSCPFVETKLLHIYISTKIGAGYLTIMQPVGQG